METTPVISNRYDQQRATVAPLQPVYQEKEGLFGVALRDFLNAKPAAPPAADPADVVFSPLPLPHHALVAAPVTLSASHVASAYEINAPARTRLSDWEKYKDDQLLKNPGGDYYDPSTDLKLTDSTSQRTFRGRIGKDLSDAWGNVKNFFENLVTGARCSYQDPNGNIAEVRQRGLIQTVADFFKDLGSALSLGTWRPDGEPVPEDLGSRVQFSFSKAREAILGDLLQGVGNSTVHLGENLALTGWNLLEIAPDATIGTVEAGRLVTTKAFDNGQVVLEYLTDIVPAGDAWLRVHAAKSDSDGFAVPVLCNLKMPEICQGDARWHTIRNTGLRKAIETVGTLVGDAFMLHLLGKIWGISHGRRDTT